MLQTKFIFRGMVYDCEFLLDSSAYPGYVFAFVTDKNLIAEFSDEIGIKTDFIIQLPKVNDYPELVDLNEAILNAVSLTPQYLAARKMLESSNAWLEKKPVNFQVNEHRQNTPA